MRGRRYRTWSRSWAGGKLRGIISVPTIKSCRNSWLKTTRKVQLLLSNPLTLSCLASGDLWYHAEEKCSAWRWEEGKNNKHETYLQNYQRKLFIEKDLVAGSASGCASGETCAEVVPSGHMSLLCRRRCSLMPHSILLHMLFKSASVQKALFLLSSFSSSMADSQSISSVLSSCVVSSFLLLLFLVLWCLVPLHPSYLFSCWYWFGVCAHSHSKHNFLLPLSLLTYVFGNIVQVGFIYKLLLTCN